MRNLIKIIDKDVPKVTVSDLEVGQMFRYPKKTNDQNVYMVTFHNPLGRAVVLLATGMIYSDFTQTSEIEVVDAISIQR